MSDPDVFALVADNRRRAATLLAGLDDEQWAAPSLCAGWSVRDVAGHLVVPFQVSVPAMALEILRSRGSIDRAMDRMAKKTGRVPTTDLVDALRENADSRFTPPMLGPEAPLSDTSIHLCDVARPLGLDHTLPPTLWRIVLDFLVSPPARRAFVPSERRAGLAFATTDQAWGAGEGAEVRGTSEAVALALAGRPVVLDELDGPGVGVLRERLGTS